MPNSNALRYRYLLFDVDNTLLDFSAGERAALFQTMEQIGLPISEPDYQTYVEINQSVWTKFEAGLLDSKAVQRLRFEEFASYLNRDPAEGPALNDRYVENLGRQAVLLDGSLNALQKLSACYRLAVVTNGLTLVQRERLKRSGFLPYLSGVFISQEMGVQKPSKEYFDFVLGALGDPGRERCLVIGDSLSADIQGGVNAGIDTCWFRKDGSPQSVSDLPTYTVYGYAELLRLLLP